MINKLMPRKNKALRLLWHILWDPICAVLAFFPLAFCNFLQFPSLLVLPFSKPLFRKYNCFLAGCAWSYWVLAIRYFIGVDFVVSGDTLPKKENAIIFSNHQGMSDIVALLIIAYQQGMIPNVKWLVKDILKYVPALGWGMLFIQCIFLKRRWADDAEKIKRTFASVLAERTPIWLMSFPEGTRYTPEKCQASNSFAESRQLPKTKHVLLPKPKGFWASLEGLRSHVGGVYSVCIGYEQGEIPGLWSLVRGDIRKVHLLVQRTAIEDMPATEEAITQWLRDDFYRKDQQLARLQHAGHFPGSPAAQELQPV